ncbi:hypothetical protein IWQ56_003448 [Coemansia nantahalensis]|nr:hypothetical protein IWQ56_003448 [Coemansia nantahalensis]
MAALFDGFFDSIESLRQPGAGGGGVDAAIGGISASMWAPRVERQESDSALRLVAHLPGVAHDQVRVDTSTPGRLRILGECCAHAVHDSGPDRVRERRLGQFEKDIPLPPGARVAGITVAPHGPDSVVITVPKDASRAARATGSSEKAASLAVEPGPGSEVVVPQHGPEREAITRRLKLKLDLRLVPYLGLLYLFNALDRGNIGNARLAGLEEGTHLTGNDFYNALSVFYAGYTISQIPNMFMLKKVTPAVLVGVTMVLWGVCSTSMAATTSFAGLAATRFFMGVFEAGIGPAAPVILSFFYLRHELAWRTALFYGSSTFAGAFGGLIAYGVATNLADKTLAPWQLLFIIEGIPTIALGVLTIFVLPNAPETLERWFVTPEERQVAIERSRAGLNTDTTALDRRQLLAALKDTKNLFTCLIYIGLNIPLASYTSFLPTIVKLMGYTDAEAQLMTVPPYACALACVFAVCWSSDRTRSRGLHVAGSAAVACAGYILLISSASTKANYAGACFVAMGLYPIIPLMLSWVANNNVGHTKRAISIAMLNTFGQCFATVGTQIYKQQTAPRFFTGYGVCLAFAALMIVVSLALVVHLGRENARRDAAYGEPKELTPEEQLAAISDGVYDEHPSFRYFT